MKLTAPSVRRLVDRAMPALSSAPLQYLSGGNDCDVWTAGPDTVLKFPRHPQAETNLKKEAALLRFLQGNTTLPVPAVQYEGAPGAEFPFFFCGISRIPGDPLTPELYAAISPSEQEQLARDLAGFLRQLHQLPIPAGLPAAAPVQAFREDLARLRRMVFPHLTRPQQQAVEDLYRRILADPVLTGGRMALVHGDFSCGNLMYDPAAGRISGVIDFGDACVGDTARDFYCLLEDSEEEIGRAFGLRVLREYGITDPAELLKKSDFHEFYWMIEETLYGFAYQDTEWIEEGLEAIRRFASRSSS